MKRLAHYLSILIFFALAFSAHPPFLASKALAQEVSIAIVDKAKVANSSKAWKNFQKQLDGDVKRWQKKVRDYESTLAQQGRGLLEGKNNLSPSDFQTKQQELQQQQLRYNEELGKEKRSLDQRVKKAEQLLNQAIDSAAAVIGQERNFTLVLNAAMVLHQNKGLDITKDVAARVNKQLKRL